MLVRDISEATAELSSLVELVQQGGDVVIAEGGRPVARLVRYSSKAKVRTPGSMAGEIWIAPDFDVLPDDMAEAFGVVGPAK